MRLRAIGVGVVAGVLAAALGAGLMASPPAAHACSIAGQIPNHALPDLLGRARVVVTGTFAAGSEDMILLRVDEGLKGAANGGTLSVHNRQTGLGADCSVIVDSSAPGGRYTPGARVLALLERGTAGARAEWIPGNLGFGVFLLDGETVAAQQPEAMPFVPGGVTLQDVRLALGRPIVPSGPGPSPEGAREEKGDGRGTPRNAILGLAALGVVAAGATWVVKRR